jgi:hypothetical protein
VQRVRPRAGPHGTRGQRCPRPFRVTRRSGGRRLILRGGRHHRARLTTSRPRRGRRSVWDLLPAYLAINPECSPQARASAQEFQDRVKFDWLGLVLDVVGLGSLAGLAGGLLPDALQKIASTIALSTNNFKTCVGSLTRLSTDWTFIPSDTALGQGPSLDTLPAQAQEQMTNALNQAGLQNVSVDSALTKLEGIYSPYNLPGYKGEIDNQFSIAGGTDLPYAMGPYMNALDSSVSGTNK